MMKGLGNYSSIDQVAWEPNKCNIGERLLKRENKFKEVLLLMFNPSRSSTTVKKIIFFKGPCFRVRIAGNSEMRNENTVE